MFKLKWLQDDLSSLFVCHGGDGGGGGGDDGTGTGGIGGGDATAGDFGTGDASGYGGYGGAGSDFGGYGGYGGGDATGSSYGGGMGGDGAGFDGSGSGWGSSAGYTGGDSGDSGGSSGSSSGGYTGTVAGFSAQDLEAAMNDYAMSSVTVGPTGALDNLGTHGIESGHIGGMDVGSPGGAPGNTSGGHGPGATDNAAGSVDSPAGAIGAGTASEASDSVGSGDDSGSGGSGGSGSSSSGGSGSSGSGSGSSGSTGSGSGSSGSSSDSDSGSSGGAGSSSTGGVGDGSDGGTGGGGDDVADSVAQTFLDPQGFLNYLGVSSQSQMTPGQLAYYNTLVGQAQNVASRVRGGSIDPSTGQATSGAVGTAQNLAVPPLRVPNNNPAPLDPPFNKDTPQFPRPSPIPSPNPVQTPEPSTLGKIGNAISNAIVGKANAQEGGQPGTGAFDRGYISDFNFGRGAAHEKGLARDLDLATNGNTGNGGTGNNGTGNTGTGQNAQDSRGGVPGPGTKAGRDALAADSQGAPNSSGVQGTQVGQDTPAQAQALKDMLARANAVERGAIANAIDAQAGFVDPGVANELDDLAAPSELNSVASIRANTPNFTRGLLEPLNTPIKQMVPVRNDNPAVDPSLTPVDPNVANPIDLAAPNPGLPAPAQVSVSPQAIKNAFLNARQGQFPDTPQTLPNLPASPTTPVTTSLLDPVGRAPNALSHLSLPNQVQSPTIEVAAAKDQAVNNNVGRSPTSITVGPGSISYDPASPNSRSAAAAAVNNPGVTSIPGVSTVTFNPDTGQLAEVPIPGVINESGVTRLNPAPTLNTTAAVRAATPAPPPQPVNLLSAASRAATQVTNALPSGGDARTALGGSFRAPQPEVQQINVPAMNTFAGSGRAEEPIVYDEDLMRLSAGSTLAASKWR
jgi:hypothetical protein